MAFFRDAEPGYGSAALTNTWRLRNAVDFDFPTNTSLAAGARLLVVGFDPLTYTTQLAAFRSRYNLSPAGPILGPWDGKLDNSAEVIELKAPDKPDVTPTNVIVPYVLIEKIAYAQAVPWPANADGFGSSLQRGDSAAYGNDPINWFAGSPSPGAINPVAPSIIGIAAGNPPIRITVNTSPGLSYLLEYKNDLNDPSWTPLPPAIPATQGTVSLTDTNPPGAQRFYRVRAQ